MSLISQIAGIGAIIGDIVGDIYEFDNIKTKDFEFFGRNNSFTDDTVMTVRVAKALMDWNRKGTLEDFKELLIDTMHGIGHKYSFGKKSKKASKTSKVVSKFSSK